MKIYSIVYGKNEHPEHIYTFRLSAETAEEAMKEAREILGTVCAWIEVYEN